MAKPAEWTNNNYNNNNQEKNKGKTQKRALTISVEHDMRKYVNEPDMIWLESATVFRICQQQYTQ